MNGEWTFAGIEDYWENESFSTKEEAIKEGKLALEGNFFVGQLFADDNEEYYTVKNIEEISN